MGERRSPRSRVLRIVGLAVGLVVVLASLVGVWMIVVPQQDYVWPDARGLLATTSCENIDTIEMGVKMDLNHADASISLTIPNERVECSGISISQFVVVYFPAGTLPAFFGEPGEGHRYWANWFDPLSDGAYAGVKVSSDADQFAEDTLAMGFSHRNSTWSQLSFSPATYWVQAQQEMETDAGIPWWEYLSGGARLLWENAFEHVGFSDYVFRFDLAGEWDVPKFEFAAENVVLEMQVPHSLEIVAASADYTSYSTYQDEEGTWFDVYGYTLNADQEAFVVRYRDENAARSKLLLVIALMFSTVVGLQVVLRSLVGWKASNC